MRILHVLDHSLPLHSGYVFRTLSILREQRALGWETVHLTSPKQGPGRQLVDHVDGWTFHRTPSGEGTRLLRQMQLTAGRLDEIIKDWRPDILHAHSPVLNALPALWIGRRHRLPVVYEMRASWEDAAVDHGTTREGSVRYRLSRLVETLALRGATEVTTICEGLRDDILARGIPAAKVTVIPNAVDIEGFRFGAPPDPELRRRLGLEDTTVLGFCGSFYAYEGLALLVDAMARLVHHHPSLRLLLVGGGPQERQLKAQVIAHGLGDRVIFTGRVPHAEIARYYSLIDVLAYPRLPMRLTELVTPLKPLEAMAQGRVLIASDVGGHRELIADQETGFLFRAGDLEALTQGITRLLSARSEWPALSDRARRFVELERNWAGSVARYAEVYERAIAAPR